MTNDTEQRVDALDVTVVPVLESLAFIPPSARLSPLAMAALQNGVSPDDVRAYLSARYSLRVDSFEQASA